MRTLQRELVRKVVFALIAFLTHGCGRFIDMYDMSCQRNTKSFVGGILDIPDLGCEPFLKGQFAGRRHPKKHGGSKKS
jgi:hypothetical protein